METDKLDELLKPDVLGNFTQMAFEFGPFFFSVLILLYVTYRANQYYLQVSTRKDPPPLPEELRARRVVFYSAWVFAFTLVAVSVSWWLYSHAPQQA